MAETRHKELVNNIANMDTPYYKARDINVKEFNDVLAESISKRTAYNPWQFRMNSGRDVMGKKSYHNHHLRSMSEVQDGHFRTGFRVLKRMDDTVMRHDQNNVTPEGEMARLNKNAQVQKAFVTLAKDKFRHIESAIRMRV